MSEKRPVVHVETNNKTFLRTFSELEALGMKGVTFFLALYDEGLKGVNPVDPKLPKSLRARVLKEIVKNPWYYYREVLRVPVSGGLTRFRLHLGNLAMLYLAHMNVNTYTVIARQNYKTYSMAAYMQWLYDFGTTYTDFIFSHNPLNECLFGSLI